MPWVRASLHGQKVYARANRDGSLAANGGRVEVCYKATASRVYRARATNVVVDDATVLPDEACVPAEGPGARSSGSFRAAEPVSGSFPSGGASGSTGSRSKIGISRTTRARKRARPEAASGGPLEEPHASFEGDGVTAVAYADGACSGNPGPAGLGVVLLDRGECTELSESLGLGTNNIAELMAIDRVLDLVTDSHRPLAIYTDSGYAIGVLSKGWKAKANVALVERIRARLAERTAIRFVHVRGHAGVPLNERADELAREAVRTGRTHKARRTLPPSGQS